MCHWTYFRQSSKKKKKKKYGPGRDSTLVVCFSRANNWFQRGIGWETCSLNLETVFYERETMPVNYFSLSRCSFVRRVKIVFLGPATVLQDSGLRGKFNRGYSPGLRNRGAPSYNKNELTRGKRTLEWNDVERRQLRSSSVTYENTFVVRSIRIGEGREKERERERQNVNRRRLRAREAPSIISHGARK